MVIGVKSDLNHARIQDISSGGGPFQSDKKSSYHVFLVLSLFYRSQMVNLQKSIIFQGSRGGPTISRGGGSNCLFPIVTPIACDFPGGSGPPVSPLDPHLRLA